MQSEPTSHPEITCQWCSGTIPENGPVCTTCGAVRPREDLVAPGLNSLDDSLPTVQITEAATNAPTDDEIRARQILKDLDAYIPEETARSSPPRDTSDDILVVVGTLVISGVTGGPLGWFLAPPMIYEIFNEVIGVDTDGPEAFRRLGAFMGALLAMLFGSLLVTIMRR